MTARLTVLLLAVATWGCSPTPDPEAGELRVIPLSGSVSLVEDGKTTLLEDAATVEAGVSVITQPGGRAQVELSGRRSLELAPETELRVDDRSSEVADGSVLVRAGSPVMLHAGGAQIEANEAIFRVDRGSSVLLGTYSGSATVLGSGVEPVTALRQANVLQGGEVPLGVQALDVRRNDPWDAELLGQAIDLGLQLLDYERGLTRQLPSGRQAGRVSQMLEQEFPRRAIRSAVDSLGSAARAAVAAVVAQEAGRLEGGSPSRILAQIVGLIQQLRANWIVVVAELGLPAAAAALTQKLGDFATSISELVSPPPAPSLTTIPSATGGPTGTGGSSSAGSSGGSGSAGGGGSGGGGGNTRPPAPPPADEDQPGAGTETQAEECSNAVECAVQDILPRELSDLTRDQP